MTEGVLYISYDGMLEPLGQSQVLGYLEKLAPGRRIHLISFEKPEDVAKADLRNRIAARIAEAGITWHPMRYHRSPTAPATAFDIAMGSWKAVTIARRHELGIVHARSYVAGVMALAVQRLAGARLLFDMRGFWPDEKVDFGSWPAHGRLHRAAKAVERKLLVQADHVVALTEASKREMLGWDYLQKQAPPITVIPTCADLDRFQLPATRPAGPFTLGYAGSVSGVYLLDDMLRCFQAVQAIEPNARLLMLNRNEHLLIRSRAQALGITGDIEIVAAEHRDVPGHVARMHAGLALYKPAYSRLACAPTKLAEYLACGVPCIGSAGVGDMGEQLRSRKVGVIVGPGADVASAAKTIVSLAREPGIGSRCRSAAKDMFALDAGVDAYAAIYSAMAAT